MGVAERVGAGWGGAGRGRARRGVLEGKNLVVFVCVMCVTLALGKVGWEYHPSGGSVVLHAILYSRGPSVVPVE